MQSKKIGNEFNLLMNNLKNMAKNSIGKMPPQNIEAEQSLLGSLLIDKDAITKVADSLLVEDFYKESHEIIYNSMLELFAQHEPIDILTLSSKLKEKKQLKNIGGRSYLAKLSMSVPTSSNVNYYAEIIQKKATLRRLINSSLEINGLGYLEDEEIETVLDKAEKSLFKVSQKHLKQNFSPINNLLTDAFERIDEIHKESGKLRGLATNFTELDNLLGGLQKSDLIILAARPSVGKTSFALDIARNVATRYKKSVGIFSLEMSKEQLVDRLICAEANVNLWKMRTGKLSDTEDDDDFSKIGHALGVLSEAPIYIDDSGIINIVEISAKARRLQMEKGLDLLIIDYLQLMKGRAQYDGNRVQEISEISRGLKGIAKELKIPILALSQLSRAVEQQPGAAIPKLSHLRESGSIEQDADVVMFIYRKASDRKYRREDLSPEEANIAEIQIAKHRNGPLGIVKLYFDEAKTSFKNLERRTFE